MAAEIWGGQRSGRQQEFPEVDRADGFSIPAAKEKVIKGQSGFLEELTQILRSARPSIL